MKEFGYEDLLAELVDQGVKIWLDLNRELIFKRNGPKKLKFTETPSKADIFISNEMPDEEIIRRFFFRNILDSEEGTYFNLINLCIFSRFVAKNIVTMAFCMKLDLDYETEMRSNDRGLFHIEYTPHQTFPDAYFLAEIINPKEIVSLQDTPIPSSLKEFCRRWVVTISTSKLNCDFSYGSYFQGSVKPPSE